MCAKTLRATYQSGYESNLTLVTLQQRNRATGYVETREAIVAEQKILNFKVKGEPPVQVSPPLYSNFLAVSQVGTEVQFEFIFLDLNQVATLIEQQKLSDIAAAPEVDGKTVVKVVMPAASFVQLRDQFEKIFAKLMAILPTMPEAINEQRSSSSKVG